MAVAVIVIAPVIVAALVNGNDIVGVIDAVNDTQPASEMGRQTGMLHFQKRDVYQRSIDMTNAPAISLSTMRSEGSQDDLDRWGRAARPSAASTRRPSCFQGITSR